MTAALLLWSVLAAPAEPMIGFVNHYPFVPGGAGEYGASGSTVALVRAPWAIIEPEHGKWDPSCIDQQLAWAREQNVRLIYVMECGPAHCVNWVRRLAGDAGELMTGPDGGTGDPSMYSPVYREHMDSYIRRVVAEIEKRDTDGRVYGYSNGCEWWYPSDMTFGRLEREAFGRAMARRYGSRAAARRAWGLRGHAPLERPPVVSDGVGDADRFGAFIPLAERLDAGWCTTEPAHVRVEVGKTYRFRAEARISASRGGAAVLEVAWLRPGVPQPMRLDHSPRVQVADDWTQLSVDCSPPPGADRAWLHLKSYVRGTVEFRNPSFRAADGGPELVAPLGPRGDDASWHFIPWLAGDKGAVSSSHGDGSVTITYAPGPATGVSSAWVDDWFDFMGDEVAEFIGHLADEIRSSAPRKPIVTYLTFAFGAPFNWDYSYAMNIHPEKVFRARRYEHMGMQLAAADGDYHHVTAAIEMVNTLGEPWMIDLQDFTAGIGIGREKMTATTLAGIDAGARGVLYYDWVGGTRDYDFWVGWPLGDIRSMVTAGRTRLAVRSTERPRPSVAIRHPKVVPFAGRGQTDPGRFMLLYKAVKLIRPHVRILTPGEPDPPGMPVFTVADVPDRMHPIVHRSTEAKETGNTPPLFKFLGNEAMVAELAGILERRLAVER